MKPEDFATVQIRCVKSSGCSVVSKCHIRGFVQEFLLELLLHGFFDIYYVLFRCMGILTPTNNKIDLIVAAN